MRTHEALYSCLSTSSDGPSVGRNGRTQRSDALGAACMLYICCKGHHHDDVQPSAQALDAFEQAAQS